MRVRLALIGTILDGERHDPLGHDGAWHLADIVEEALEPALQIHAVPQHQIGRLRLHHILRRGLVIVDLSAWLGDRFDDGSGAGHVLRDVLDHGEGRDHPQRLVSGAPGRTRLRHRPAGQSPWRKRQQGKGRTQPAAGQTTQTLAPCPIMLPVRRLHHASLHCPHHAPSTRYCNWIASVNALANDLR
jgi:hypothetical protein